MRKYLVYLVFIFFACKSEKEPCYVYRTCIGDYEGRFCTDGIKFGDNFQFGDFGVDVGGPAASGNVVTYSFQTSGIYPANHHGEFESKSFDEIGPFAKTKIIEALEEWASHIDLTFEKTDDQENSDLKIICADIEDKAGIGWLRCLDNDCAKPEGFLFFKNDPISEENFYSLALHEIGHVLGLCHSNGSNIMSYNSTSYNFDKLQAGDIEGIISIYGAK